MKTVLFGWALVSLFIVLDYWRRQQRPLAPNERLERFRKLLAAPGPVARNSAGSRRPEARVAPSLGETARVIRFKIRLDADRGSAA